MWNELNIPYHLAFPSIICITGLLIILFYRKKLFDKNNPSRARRWTALSVFLVSYLFIVGGATYEDLYYQWDYHRYDLNKDGLIDGSEVTEESKQALANLVNDTGRNFSFISGLIFAGLISFIVYLSSRLISKFSKK